MTWNTQMCILVYSTVLILNVISMVVTFLKVKRTEAVYMLLLNQAMIVLWLVFGMHEVQSVNEQELHFAVRFSLFPICMGGGTWLIFALVYAEWITLKNYKIIALIMVPKIFLFLPTLTNRWYHLILLEKTYENPSITHWGYFANMNFNLTYTYIAAGSIIIIVKSLRDVKKLNKKVFFIAISPFISMSINILQRFQIINEMAFDWTPVSFSIFALFISIAIFRYRAFDLVRNVAVEMLNESGDAILILDPGWRIVEYNDVADRYFSALKASTGKSLEDVFEGLIKEHEDGEPIQEVYERIHGSQDFEEHHLVLMNRNEEKRYYAVSKKSVFTDEGDFEGTIVKVSNRTKQSKKVIKDERIRISGELHDNISNMVNVVSMNLEYAMDHMGDPSDVEVCIRRAHDASKRIRVSLRRILDELAPFNLTEVGIIYALNSLFKRLEGIGILIDFTHEGVHDTLNYNKRYGDIMYSVCVEAVNNALFNGKATAIIVDIDCQNHRVEMVISDNGEGCENVAAGRGLTNMEKRLVAVDGKVEYESEVGKGFALIAEFPVEE